jgi:hypothetical protein
MQGAHDARARSALGRALLDQALTHVERGANPEWMAVARREALAVASRLKEFTTDDIWEALVPIGVRTDEPRAMGHIMAALARAGVAVNTRRTVQSRRPECHVRPVTVWASTITLGPALLI